MLFSGFWIIARNNPEERIVKPLKYSNQVHLLYLIKIFIKCFLLVSVFYTPYSGRTLYYLLKTICFLHCFCVLELLCRRLG